MQEPRVVLDTLVQSSTVDLFHSFKLAVAPLHRSLVPTAEVRYHELTAGVSFTGQGFSGNLIIGVPNEVFAMVPQDTARNNAGRDWTREIANQLMGRIKSRLLQFGVTLQTGLPALLSKEAAVRQRLHGPALITYHFRTLRGEIVVTISGDIDYSIFVYTRLLNVPAEGDIILF